MKILGESNGKLSLRTCPGCRVPEPYRSHDCALVPAQTSPRAEYYVIIINDYIGVLYMKKYVHL